MENKEKPVLYKSKKGVNVWVNMGKNGKYFTVDIPLLNIKVPCFKFEPTEKKE